MWIHVIDSHFLFNLLVDISYPEEDYVKNSIINRSVNS